MISSACCIFYGVILNRKDLIKNESEFKSGKLGLVVDSLDLINLPYPLGSDLISSIIDAWSLEIYEKDLK